MALLYTGMAQNSLARVEVLPDDDSVLLLLFSEDDSVEDSLRLSFDELQSASGERFVLFGEDDDGSAPEPVTDYELPELGATAVDTERGQEVTVERVLPGVRSDRYVVEGPHAKGHVPEPRQDRRDKTVADKNLDHPPGATVVIAKYRPEGDLYAFPSTRLDW